jgi:hypothetical protein
VPSISFERTGNHGDHIRAIERTLDVHHVQLSIIGQAQVSQLLRIFGIGRLDIDRVPIGMYQTQLSGNTRFGKGRIGLRNDQLDGSHHEEACGWSQCTGIGQVGCPTLGRGSPNHQEIHVGSAVIIESATAGSRTAQTLASGRLGVAKEQTASKIVADRATIWWYVR